MVTEIWLWRRICIATRGWASLPLQAVKQRAVFLADIATVHLESRDIDEACCVATQAADALHLAGYATGTGRLLPPGSSRRRDPGHPTRCRPRGARGCPRDRAAP
jgi:hypothetical protein